jgi:hypothetical protein
MATVLSPVPQPLPGNGAGFWLPAAEYEPRDDPAWVFADDVLRDRLTRYAGALAAAIWDRARAKGLDRFGVPLAPISPTTRKHRRSAMGPADPDAPPLTPAWDASRTRSFLQRRVQVGTGVWFWWKRDPTLRKSWGIILQYHAFGLVRGAPVRDVIGLSPRELLEIRVAVRRWWILRRARAAWESEGRPVQGTMPTPIKVAQPKPRPTAAGPTKPPPPKPDPFGSWWGDQRTEVRRARSGVDAMGGQTLPAGTTGRIFLAPPPSPPPAILPPAWNPTAPRTGPVLDLLRRLLNLGGG